MISIKINNEEPKEAIYLSPEKSLERERILAHHCEKHSAYAIISEIFSLDEICDVREIVYQNDLSGIFLNKISPFRKNVAIVWFLIKKIGIFNQFYNFWHIKMSECQPNIHKS